MVDTILNIKEFDYLTGYMDRLNGVIEKLIDSGVKPGEIEYIQAIDYSQDCNIKTMVFTMRIARKVVLPNSVKPTSIQTYTNSKGEEYTELRYIFDTDFMKD